MRRMMRPIYDVTVGSDHQFESSYLDVIEDGDDDAVIMLMIRW